MLDFSDSRWDKVTGNWKRWWDGTLDRPIVTAQLDGALDPGRPKPSAPILSQGNLLDFSIPPEAFIDRLDYELSCRSYIGDAFPYVSMDASGPGLVAAFLGSPMDDSSGRIWFKKMPGIKSLEDMHLEYNEDHPALRRFLDIYRAGHERWGDQVLMSFPDLGGGMDILASLRGSEELLMDLYDCPEEVERLMGEISVAWLKYLRLFESELKPFTRGYASWLACFGPDLTYTTQSDFSYMISPDMFNRFAYPELAVAWSELPYAVYHLDGVGELPHLSKMLSNPDLCAIQWVPGDGQPDETHWPDVYRDITGAGKRAIVNSIFAMPDVIKQTGKPELIMNAFNAPITRDNWEKAMGIVNEYV